MNENPKFNREELSSTLKPIETIETKGLGEALDKSIGNTKETAEALSKRLHNIETTFQGFPEDGKLILGRDDAGNFMVTMQAEGWPGIHGQTLENYLNDCQHELGSKIAAISGYTEKGGRDISSSRIRGLFFRHIQDRLSELMRPQ